MSVNEVLPLLRVLLSGPSVTLIIFLIALWLFRGDLSALVRRIVTVKFPGGEITTSQAARAEDAPAAHPNTPIGATYTPDLPENMNLSPEHQQRILDLVC